jgi:hypothetical protein
MPMICREEWAKPGAQCSRGGRIRLLRDQGSQFPSFVSKKEKEKMIRAAGGSSPAARPAPVLAPWLAMEWSRDFLVLYPGITYLGWKKLQKLHKEIATRLCSSPPNPRNKFCQLLACRISATAPAAFSSIRNVTKNVHRKPNRMYSAVTLSILECNLLENWICITRVSHRYHMSIN